MDIESNSIEPPITMDPNPSEVGLGVEGGGGGGRGGGGGGGKGGIWDIVSAKHLKVSTFLINLRFRIQ